MRTDLSGLSEKRDEGRRNIEGFNRAKPNSGWSFGTLQSFKKFLQRKDRREILSVGTDVDAGEDDLFESFLLQSGAMLDDSLRRKTPRSAAGMGNDAIRTMGIASILDLQERSRVSMKRGEWNIEKSGLLLDVADLESLHAALFNLRKQLRDEMLLPIPQKIGDSLHLRKCLRFNLGITAGHDEE
jgi:hypothetical protein